MSSSQSVYFIDSFHLRIFLLLHQLLAFKIVKHQIDEFFKSFAIDQLIGKITFRILKITKPFRQLSDIITSFDPVAMRLEMMNDDWPPHLCWRNAVAITGRSTWHRGNSPCTCWKRNYPGTRWNATREFSQLMHCIRTLAALLNSARRRCSLDAHSSWP